MSWHQSCACIRSEQAQAYQTHSNSLLVHVFSSLFMCIRGNHEWLDYSCLVLCGSVFSLFLAPPFTAFVGCSADGVLA
eukprot:m.487071 g.487071  ORF g.487071 m.487071 type:complete len:78 (+) comp57219_c0_seq6:1911-2144(+)